MKSNKGVTLVSLIVYIIVLTAVVGMVATFTKYFYKNTDDIYISNNTTQDYSRFITYLTDNINSRRGCICRI